VVRRAQQRVLVVSVTAVLATQKIDWQRIGHLAFAGGGNRCWWQGGVCDHLIENGWTLPRHLSGTSAGIAIAASLAVGRAHDALAPCAALYRANPHVLERLVPTHRRWQFAHDRIYPAWLDGFLTPQRWSQFQARGLGARHELHIAVGRFRGPQWPILATTLGLSAYLIDKFVLRQTHPVLPRNLGLAIEFFTATHHTPFSDLRRWLIAAASASPVLNSPKLNGKLAMDGGFCDNAPVPPLSRDDLHGKDHTLVLLTRHNPRLPSVFSVGERTYWQPSHAVRVSTWDCTPGTDIDVAYQHGRIDAKRWF
jgi:predicted acylesterase/phospholipase RssA